MNTLMILGNIGEQKGFQIEMPNPYDLIEDVFQKTDLMQMLQAVMTSRMCHHFFFFEMLLLNLKENQQQLSGK